MSTILVDMDGVLADWGSGYGIGLDAYGEAAAAIARHEDQTSFNLHLGLTPEQSEIVDVVMARMSYRMLSPIEGGIEAVRSLHDMGHDVRICTSPWLPNRNCIKDKLDWVSDALGSEWTEKVIVTKDKTLVRGDFLIDDKPGITGLMTPEWQQILFTQPYNRDVTHLPRMNNWSEVMTLIEEGTE